MQAIQVQRLGGPEVLELVEVEQPQPGPGQVRVEVAAAGVNFIDVYHRTGLYPKPLPFIPGDEGAGKVVAVGPGVETVKVGDRVASTNLAGAYAQFAGEYTWNPFLFLEVFLAAALPFLALFLFGYGYMGTMSLLQTASGKRLQALWRPLAARRA